MHDRRFSSAKRVTKRNIGVITEKKVIQHCEIMAVIHRKHVLLIRELNGQ